MLGVVTMLVAPEDFELGGIRVVCTGAHCWVGGVRCGNDADAIRAAKGRGPSVA